MKRTSTKELLHRIYPIPIWISSWLYFAYILSRPFMTDDTDFWWHLAAGREIVEKKVFLFTDVFSHTLLNTSWINFEWLTQVLFYLTYKFGGYQAIYLGKFMLSFATLGLLVVTCRSLGAKKEYLLLFLWIGFSILNERFYEKPELFSFVLFILFLNLLTVSRGWSPSRLRWLPAILFGLMVFWCNAHGGFIYGLGLIVLLNFGARLAKLNPQYISALDKSIIAVLLAIFINPHGPLLLNVLVEHLVQLRAENWLIIEWRPTTISDVPLYWISMAVCVAAVIGGSLAGHVRSILFWLPVLIVFLFYATRAVRNAAYAPLVFLPFLSNCLLGFKTFEYQYRIYRKAILLGIFVIAIFIFKENEQKIALGKIILTDKLPYKACRFIKDNNIVGNLHNDYGQGGFLGWELGPERKIFMDGRYIFHPLVKEESQLFRGTIKYAGRECQKFLSKYKVTYAIHNIAQHVNQRTDLTIVNHMYPKRFWALVYWDDLSLVFLKRDPMYQDLITRYEYKTLWPYNLNQMSVLLKAKKLAQDDVKRELVRHLHETGPTKINQQIMNLLNQ